MHSLPQFINGPAPIQASPRGPTAADLGLEGLVERGAPRGLYLHVPFCFHKCHYCDFYSLVDDRGRQPAFARRLIGEMQASRPWLTGELETVFAGGGTPTLLEADLWRELLQAMGRSLRFSPGFEFTVEANPETLTAPLLDVLTSGGVNRMSIGAQSFDPRHLKTLERWHEPPSVARSVRLARAAGIGNLNLDLIFAIPGQTLEEWLTDLEAALALEPDHLSCYGLTYEPGTPLAAKLRAGAIRRVDEEIEAAMYEATAERLERAGFVRYEISNWARPGRACRHNLIYWENESWWALGPGASGHVAGVRWKNAPRLDDYLAAAALPRVVDVERLDEDGRAGEAFMLGLRLIEGLSLARVESLLALGRRGAERSRAIDRHVHGGLLERAGGRLRLSRRGLLLADQVVADLL